MNPGPPGPWWLNPWFWVAVVAIAAILAVIKLFQNAAQARAALGTLPNGSTPSTQGLGERWTGSPAVITVGTQATFTFTVDSTNVLSGVTSPVSGREYLFNVQPGANIRIDSVTPA